jgi:hypothetical protein
MLRSYQSTEPCPSTTANRERRQSKADACGTTPSEETLKSKPVVIDLA